MQKDINMMTLLYHNTLFITAVQKYWIIKLLFLSEMFHDISVAKGLHVPQTITEHVFL